MEVLRALLDDLGGAGAARNAEAALFAHRAQEEAVEAVLRRLAERDPEVAPAA